MMRVFGPTVRPLDTTDAAHVVQMDAYREMSPDRRSELAIEMSEDLRLVTLDGPSERHPAATDSELVLLLIELWHGPEIAGLVSSSTRSHTRS